MIQILGIVPLKGGARPIQLRIQNTINSLGRFHFELWDEEIREVVGVLFVYRGYILEISKDTLVVYNEEEKAIAIYELVDGRAGEMFDILQKAKINVRYFQADARWTKTVESV